MKGLIIKLSTITILLVLCNCNGSSDETGGNEVNVTNVEISEADLIRMGYDSLFKSSNSKLDSLWNASKNGLSLRNILLTPGTSNESRFIAAEILFLKDDEFPTKKESEILAEVYPSMLLNSDYHAYLIDEMRIQGEGSEENHLVSLGVEAIPYLYNLLDSEAPYKGIKFRIRGNPNYSVKHIAAMYICEILDKPYGLLSDSLVEKLKLDLPDSLKQITTN